MKWVTAQNVEVDGVACPWLITRFIDDEAEFGFIPADKVLSVAERDEALSFATPGARYDRRDGKCTFDILIEAFNLIAPGLQELAEIVQGATLAPEGAPPEAAGLRAVAAGFALAMQSDIERQRLQWPVYDALLAWCAEHEQGDAVGEID